MTFFPVFLSIVFVVRNQSAHTQKILSDAASCIDSLVSDSEIIIVDTKVGLAGRYVIFSWVVIGGLGS